MGKISNPCGGIKKAKRTLNRTQRELMKKAGVKSFKSPI